MSADAKEVLKGLKRFSPTLKIPGGGGYKKRYSETVWALVDQIVEENERLEKRAENLESTLKQMINLSQLAMSDLRSLRKVQLETTSQLKALPRGVGIEDGGAEEVDLKGE